MSSIGGQPHAQANASGRSAPDPLCRHSIFALRCRAPSSSLRLSQRHTFSPSRSKILLTSGLIGESTTTFSAMASAGTITAPSEYVREIWRGAQAVCFDVDSTLCEDESIDELAAFLGVGDEVAAMTASAMGGKMLFQDALRQRLNIMQPSLQKVQEFLVAHPPRISKGIPELVALLQSRGTGAFLVSGGFRVIIDPIADILNIPRGNVFANRILFKEDGSYAGFDEAELTSRSGGKAAAARLIKEKHGYERLVMVGDGATDLEARQPGGAEIFIGYGGVVERTNIAQKADWYIYSIEELITALQ